MSEFVKKRIRKSKNGKEHSLGNYATKEEAVIAREKGEKIYHNPILEGAT